MECKKSGVSWIHTKEQREQQAGNCKLGNEFPVCMRGGELLTSWPFVGFSDRILLVGIGLTCTSYLTSLNTFERLKLIFITYGQ